MRTFIVIKELNKEFVNISVQSAKELESQKLSEKRLVLFETQQPQRVMNKIHAAFRRSHVSGPLYAVSFDELLAFMQTDGSLQKLLVQAPARSEVWNAVGGLVLGALGGALVLAYIVWGVMAAMAIGIVGAILLSKK